MAIDLLDDDRAMLAWGPRLRDDLGLPATACTSLATTIYDEMLNSSFAAGPPADIMRFDQRFNEIALFMNYLGETQSAPERSALQRHAELVLSNYVCFVYLGDVCFTKLRKSAASSSVTRRCCEFLTDNPVRAFRNAVSHGNWVIEDGLVRFWARKGADPTEAMSEFTVTDGERRFWFFLSLCVAKAAMWGLTNHCTGPGPQSSL